MVLQLNIKDWLYHRWPDASNLRPLALAVQFGSFIFIWFFTFLCFYSFAGPYGWPAKSFIKYVPLNVQAFLSLVGVLVFTAPVVVSGIFYVLLVYSRCKPGTNRVGEAPVELSSLEDDVFTEPVSQSPKDIIQKSIKNDKFSGSFTNSLLTIENGTEDQGCYFQENQFEIKPMFDYNKILRESGQPYEDLTYKNSNNESSVCKDGYFEKEGRKNSRRNKTKLTKVNVTHNCSKICINDNIYKNRKEISCPKIFTIVEYPNTSQCIKNGQPIPKNVNCEWNSIEIDTTFQKTENQNGSQTDKMTFARHSQSSSFQQQMQFTKITDKSRTEAERISALRSIETNLIMILWFYLSNIFLLFPSKFWKTYFCLVNTSIQKALLPLVTTIANFGTVRSLGTELLKKLLKD